MTQFCLQPGLHSISCLPLPSPPELLLTQLPWAPQLCPLRLELHRAELEPPENLRGIPESPRAVQEGISITTGESLCSGQGTQHFPLLTPHPYVTDALQVPSAEWSLTGTAGDNLLPKPLLPKDGLIEENS